MKTCACKPKPCALRSRASHARHSWPQIIACDVINPDHIRVTFDTIGGLEDIKRALVRAAKRLRRALRPAPHALRPSPAARSMTWSSCRSYVRSCSSAASC
jgi:hypothetical protein